MVKPVHINFETGMAQIKDTSTEPASNGNTYVSYKWVPIKELMQYTGLKDKNGVEIYEGDIIRGETDRFASPRYIGNNRKGRDFVGITEYSQGSFRMVIKDKKVINYLGGKTQLFFKGNDDYEVIGNIYEHPHLLEKEK